MKGVLKCGAGPHQSVFASILQYAIMSCHVMSSQRSRRVKTVPVVLPAVVLSRHVGEHHAKLAAAQPICQSPFFCDSDLISGAKWFSLASGPHKSDPLTLKFTASVRVRSDRVGGRERCGGSGNLRGFARGHPPSPTIRTASIRDRRHDHLGNATPDPRAMR